MTLSVTPCECSCRGLKLIVMSRGHDLDLCSFRRAFSRELWVLTVMFDHKTGVLTATSAQYRQTSINVETISGSSSSALNTPITNIEAKISHGRRWTGDCKRTACSKCVSSSSLWLISEAIFESKLLRASRKWGIDALDATRGR